ncbi:MAG: signal recognition particle-docking protein FtsY [Actinomycetaceae bacterium]|nr:signal recognition particle-docking protein FtsY [Arcanobacterium sp.]MDD7505810.1 signal recognition particle-docking protein FtsY [Actinomycetaceae bacterium]MDY6142879.1 signal recognition particle-docking protein FtsY [Arcanobacterium sp.]
MDPQIIAIIVAAVLALAGVITAFALKARNRGRNKPLPPTSAKRRTPEISSDTASPVDAPAVEYADVPRGDDATQTAPVRQGEEEPARQRGDDAQAPDTSGEEELAPAPSAPSFETPESLPSRMKRLRARLARSGAFGNAVLSIFSRGDLSPADWEEIEDTLLMADVGLDATTELMDRLRQAAKVEASSDPAVIKTILRRELLELVGTNMDRSLNLSETHTADGTRAPASILMVGVNGTGKTTTVGKLARLLVADGKKVLLGAADTFRAAAAEQLQTWGERVGVGVVRSEREGADPASVAYDAVARGINDAVDVVLVDTAGRLQNKTGLMDELGKIKRVMQKQAPVNEVLLVLDATTGQNGMQQARVFAEATGVTGIVLSKLDGTAKGGIVISVQRELGVPVKYVGLGEGADDLAPFDPESFVDSLLA